MDYLDINRKAWDNRTKIHFESEFYSVDDFIQGSSSLTEIDFAELVDVKGKRLLHMQCHFGLDTLSWAREGAIATGVDLSPASIDKAKELSKVTGIPAEFVCTDIYQVPDLVREEFDIVYTSYGSIEWLPDVERWASVVAAMLVKGGTFYMAEFHPFFSSLRGDPYFSSDNEPIEAPTYTGDGNTATETICVWNHPISRVINALIAQGLVIKQFNEFPYSPYNCFEGLVEEQPGQYYSIEGDVPIVYTILAEKIT